MILAATFLLKRARYISRAEGWGTLSRLAIITLAGYFFQHKAYYLYRTDLEIISDRSEAEFMPKIKNFTLKIIGNGLSINELPDDIQEAWPHTINARQRLDKGAIAFCLFIGGELAHISWVATTEEAKRTIDSLPYRVDFSNKEACIADVVTKSRYRGAGISSYVSFMVKKFLKTRGVVALRFVIATDNIAPQRSHAKFTPELQARVSYWKVLCWQFWKEEPISQAGHHRPAVLR